jgi:hypothetical protein
MRSRLFSKLISSALSRKPAMMALGGRDFHLKAVSTMWTYPPLQKIVRELYAKK